MQLAILSCSTVNMKDFFLDLCPARHHVFSRHFVKGKHGMLRVMLMSYIRLLWHLTLAFKTGNASI